MKIWLKFLVYCIDPPLVQHATHNGAPDINIFQLETVLKYACYPGYLTVGFAHAKCFLYNDTAQWFGPDITCKGNLDFIKHLWHGKLSQGVTLNSHSCPKSTDHPSRFFWDVSVLIRPRLSEKANFFKPKLFWRKKRGKRICVKTFVKLDWSLH